MSGSDEGYESDDLNADDPTRAEYTLKFVVDGAETLPAVIAGLRDLVNELEERAGAGWELDAPVDGGNIALSAPSGSGPTSV